MKKIKITLGIGILSLGFLACNNVSHHKQEVTSLAKAFEGKFLIGAALNSAQILGEDTAALKLVASQFNSIVAENSMKSEVLQPQAGVFDFTESDKLVELGQKNKAFVVGHNLVWHSQAPAWFFVDKEGNDVSRDTLIERMKNHIHEVVGRYRGKIKGWDVVNEALNEDGSLRKSKFYHIIGPEYIELAFQFAHEADQDAELYYNDYNMYKPEKRKGAVHLIENLKAKGLRVDAIGMQAHYGLNKDLTKEIEESIMAFANTGVKVMITELDVSVLPFPAEEITAEVSQSYQNKPEYNPYVEAVPDSIQKALADYYANLFKVYLKHNDKISRITFWGVNDSQTWRNYWPIEGRTDYPLLFDRNNQPKPVYNTLIYLAKN
ncbi:endo-1,4-beta-xylanase [Saccharicrinis fermentans]|uniref:Beta-xylanase n=1 Tax=Saccharicrinis fermentans DSM 9555 = JCM 21142 TaxID=869213 RepID=W7YFG0_9BACT|nr:endo-1,4-beta-xylanase [Saccharicrinis fermentans]GAF03176.1 endo-1,4-beta-xylanase [Saccharicrinis fermentans DSM 9555 = JCM 21142]